MNLYSLNQIGDEESGNTPQAILCASTKKEAEKRILLAQKEKNPIFANGNIDSVEFATKEEMKNRWNSDYKVKSPYGKFKISKIEIGRYVKSFIEIYDYYKLQKEAELMGYKITYESTWTGDTYTSESRIAIYLLGKHGNCLREQDEEHQTNIFNQIKKEMDRYKNYI